MTFSSRAFEYWYRTPVLEDLELLPLGAIKAQRCLSCSIVPWMWVQHTRFLPLAAIVSIGFDHRILSVVRSKAGRPYRDTKNQIDRTVLKLLQALRPQRE